MKKKHIIWQGSKQSLVDSFQKKNISQDTRGAYIYEYYAAMALSKNYRVTMDKNTVRRPDENPLGYWLRLISNRIDGDVFIKSDSALTLGKRYKSAIEIGVLHHIELSIRRLSLKGRISLINYNRRLRKLDFVVAVSQYWSDYLKKIGCKNVKVIYNAFNLDEFVFPREEVVGFLEKENIARDRPIIYIGYAKSYKGALEVYNVLKDENCTLIMTGIHSHSFDLPVQCLLLSRRDYLRLLAACDVVVTMSKVEEGWTRIAHEAMLCKTPVVGSGSGGMKELLEGGGQVICNDIKKLPTIIKDVIDRKEELGLRGYEFAKRFDLESFNRAWNDFLKEVAGF